jgi:hypothetical protein
LSERLRPAIGNVMTPSDGPRPFLRSHCVAINSAQWFGIPFEKWLLPRSGDSHAIYSHGPLSVTVTVPGAAVCTPFPDTQCQGINEIMDCSNFSDPVLIDTGEHH